jgi:hypothetical protein
MNLRAPSTASACSTGRQLAETVLGAPIVRFMAPMRDLEIVAACHEVGGRQLGLQCFGFGPSHS